MGNEGLDYGIFGAKDVASPSLFDGRTKFDNDFDFGMDDGGYDLPDSLDDSDDMFGANDFGSDSGNDYGDSSWDDFNSGNKESNSNENGDAGGANPKKIAIAAIIMGLVLILLVLMLLRITKNKDNVEVAQNNNVVQQQQMDTQSNNYEYSNQNNGYASQQQIQQQVQQQVQQVPEQNTYKTEQPTQNNGWVQINDKYLAFVNVVQSTFTVERVDVYAKQNGNETNVKAVAVGTITGLTGKYELDVPYQGLENLVSGTVLNVEYSYLTSGNTKVIGTIKFI